MVAIIYLRMQENYQPFVKSQNFDHFSNWGKSCFCRKVRQESGQKKGIKRFYLPNFLSFTIPRAGYDPATS